MRDDNGTHTQRSYIANIHKTINWRVDSPVTHKPNASFHFFRYGRRKNPTENAKLEGTTEQSTKNHRRPHAVFHRFPVSPVSGSSTVTAFLYIRFLSPTSQLCPLLSPLVHTRPPPTNTLDARRRAFSFQTVSVYTRARHVETSRLDSSSSSAVFHFCGTNEVPKTKKPTPAAGGVSSLFRCCCCVPGRCLGSERVHHIIGCRLRLRGKF